MGSQQLGNHRYASRYAALVNHADIMNVNSVQQRRLLGI
jgi:hypothetical protein